MGRWGAVEAAAGGDAGLLLQAEGGLTICQVKSIDTTPALGAISNLGSSTRSPFLQLQHQPADGGSGGIPASAGRPPAAKILQRGVEPVHAGQIQQSRLEAIQAESPASQRVGEAPVPPATRGSIARPKRR